LELLNPLKRGLMSEVQISLNGSLFKFNRKLLKTNSDGKIRKNILGKEELETMLKLACQYPKRK
jgi:hypothetical protein